MIMDIPRDMTGIALSTSAHYARILQVGRVHLDKPVVRETLVGIIGCEL